MIPLNEKLVEWKPFGKLLTKMYVTGTSDTDQGLNIKMERGSDSRTIYELNFEYYFSYRNTKEHFLLNKWHSYEREKLIASNMVIIQNSEYLEWLKNSGIGFHNDLNAQHYAIFTPEDCIEVLSSNPPTVNIIRL